MTAFIKKPAALLLLAAFLSALYPGVLALEGALTGGVLPFFGGSGTEDDPYLISSEDELRAFASLVGSGESCEGLFFLLTEDVALSGGGEAPNRTPAGTGANGEITMFRGSFSGGGHTVSRMRAAVSDNDSPAGIFAGVECGEIRDLVLSSAFVSGHTRSGGLAGVARDAVIENVSFTGSAECSAAGDHSLGGIAGSAEGASMTGCSAAVLLEGSEYAGGLCGIAQDSSFAFCRSSGTVSASQYSGGVCGFCFDCVFSDCVNEAAVTGEDHRIGGVAGNARTSDFERCENLGEISGERYIGGVTGFCCGCSLVSCSNRGPVHGSWYVGGVVGWSDDGAEFGDSGLVNRLKYCMNTGAVTGEWGAGGIIGDSHDAVAEDCFSTGSIFSDEYAGGIAGYSAESSFIRCCGVGNVRADSFEGAVVGKVSYVGSEFENCVFL